MAKNNSLRSHGVSGMNVDISSTLRATLLNIGISKEHIGAFDLHSSMEINFKTINPIFITVENDRVWMWSQLKKHFTIDFHARELLGLLQHALPWVVTGQAVLGKGQDGYEVKALLVVDCIVSPEKLQSALDGFYSLMVSIDSKLN